MTQDEIRAIALEVANGIEWDCMPTSEDAVRLCAHFLAAITAKAEPFMWWDGEAVVDNAFVAEHKLQKYDFMVPLYTHPAIEQAQNLYREIYEVWAGSEGVPMPQTCVESYLLGLIEQMRDLAKEGEARACGELAEAKRRIAELEQQRDDLLAKVQEIASDHVEFVLGAHAVVCTERDEYVSEREAYLRHINASENKIAELEQQIRQANG